MNRVEAIKILREWRGKMADHGVPDFGEKYKALGVAIEALQDDWIPLNDDSAAPGYKVMCQDRYENMMIGYAWVDEYGIWMCEDNNTIMDDVVAWRPLPAP